MRSLILILGIVITATSCTNNLAISKRKYRKGFYHNLNNLGKNINSEIESKLDSTKKTSAKSTKNQNRETSNGHSQNESDTLDTSTSNAKNQTLVTTTGDSISIIIESIDENQIKFKKASNPSGPNYIRNTEEIKQLLDANGKALYTDLMDHSIRSTKNENRIAEESEKEDSYGYLRKQNSDEGLKQHPAATVSFMFGVISLAMLLLGGLGISWSFIAIMNATGWDALTFIVYGLLIAAIFWIQSILAGIIALINGIISTISIYKKGNKKYKKDPKAIFGLGAGSLIVLGLLFSVIIAILSNIL